MMNSGLSFECEIPMNKLRKRFSMERICNVSIPTAPKTSLARSTELNLKLTRRVSLSALDDRCFWNDQLPPSRTQPSVREALSPPDLVVCGSDVSLHTSSCSIVSSDRNFEEKQEAKDVKVDTTSVSPERKTHQGFGTLLQFALFFFLGAFIQQIKMDHTFTKTGHFAAHDNTKTLRPMTHREIKYDGEIKLLLSEIQELDAIVEEQNDTRAFLQLGHPAVYQYKEKPSEAVEELHLLQTELNKFSAENIALQQALFDSKKRAAAYEKEVDLLLTEVREFDKEDRLEED